MSQNDSQPTRRTLRAIPGRLVLAALLAAAGCTGDTEPDRAFPKGLGGGVAPDASRPEIGAGGAAEAPPGAAGGTAAPPGVPAARADTGWSVGATSGEAGGGMATQRAVRVARNEGYDRIVLELGPDAFPGWHI
ncbi:MAG TPA: hypothetical protein VK939_01715, partial [Longimicrobiales bacterium]|nr:hypothetical protein [Longimicrobiales bacterium]